MGLSKCKPTIFKGLSLACMNKIYTLLLNYLWNCLLQDVFNSRQSDAGSRSSTLVPRQHGKTQQEMGNTSSADTSLSESSSKESRSERHKRVRNITEIQRRVLRYKIEERIFFRFGVRSNIISMSYLRKTFSWWLSHIWFFLSDHEVEQIFHDGIQQVFCFFYVFFILFSA